MFSRAGTWTIFILFFLLLWVVSLMGSLTWHEGYRITHPAAPAPQKPFAFAEPTNEERAAIEAERMPENTIAIPVNKPIRVFACPKRSCTVLGTISPGEDLIVWTDSVPDKNGWIVVPWKTAGGTYTAQGFVNADDIASGWQAPPPPPENMLTPENIVPEKDVPADAVPIDPQTLVGIVCEFTSDDAYDKKITRGSGALITNDGYIITARSVVDLGFLNDGLENFKVTQCLVGQLPASDPLPSTEAIRKINAFVRIPYLSYTADVAYVPQEGDASDYENAWLDFAILKISGVNSDARYFGGPDRLPDSFPAAPFLISELPKIGQQTLNFAFPSGTTVGVNADIKTLFMQGLLSSVTGYWAGDKRYADNLFLIESHLDTEDTAGGRFGSPIFWKGFVIGVHTAKQQGSRQIYNVSAKAVLDDLFDNQFIIPLDVQ